MTQSPLLQVFDDAKKSTNSVPPKDPFPPPSTVIQQLRNFRSKLPRHILEKHERATPYIATRQIFMDWLVGVVSWRLYVNRPNSLTFVIAMFVMAYSQRGISNLMHDCGHYNLFSSKRLNVFVGDVCLGPAMMGNMRSQREGHVAHHQYLGSKDDPDHGLGNETSLKHYRVGRFDHKSMFSLFWFDLWDAQAFVQNALGSIEKDAAHLVAWWIILGLLLGPFERPLVLTPALTIPFAWRFCMLWHAARCTITYAIYIFREVIDHSGLPSDTILEFTRTSPCCNLLQKYLQPHDDNYHLLHHLMPKVPMGNLHELHLWLVDNISEYAEANRYENYIWGDNALLTQKIHTH